MLARQLYEIIELKNEFFSFVKRIVHLVCCDHNIHTLKAVKWDNNHWSYVTVDAQERTLSFNRYYSDIVVFVDFLTLT